MPAFSGEMLRNASIIYQVGRQVGASSRDIQIALITAMQESGLRNLNYGHGDSLGLFQQRPSMAWGSRSQVTDPVYAARAFFTGAGTNSGLLQVGNRENMGLAEAAQAVQRSAFPSAYNKHIPLMRQMWKKIEKDGPNRLPVSYNANDDITNLPSEELLDDATGLPSPVADMGMPSGVGLSKSTPSELGEVDVNFDPWEIDQPASQLLPELTPGKFETIFSNAGVRTSAGSIDGVKGWRRAVIDAARSAVGVPYVWGGNSLRSGVDCSGLVQQAFARAGINLPRVSFQQANSGRRVPIKNLEPGDLVAWDNSSRNPGADHIAIYLGNGRILEAPRTGLNVRIRALDPDGEGAWGVKLDF